MRARLVSFFVVLLALAVPALAQDGRGGGSLDRILPQIRHSMPGRFYDAEGPFFGPSGQSYYRIKWMTPDGRIIWFAADARTGQIMGGAPSGGAQPYRADAPDDRRDYDRRDYAPPRNNFEDRRWDRGSRDDRYHDDRSRDDRSRDDRNGRGRYDRDSDRDGDRRRPR
ncbi:hypothetical protein FHS83_000938 [Rhizomicrobium palustre]|uniref:Uncharacterized protein n=1 Tax=Rhizomicrobium palustre TaxID=189966 RepID=A0A846MX75_9PROT|nr:hypothetical protein [Rhizomicrobium palustre]NIK87620.1 hypothetical protein [Rhizomicrobium palustre]